MDVELNYRIGDVRRLEQQTGPTTLHSTLELFAG